MMNNFQIPMQLVQMFKGGNPQQIATNILQQKAGNNPMMQNVLNMMNSQDQSGLEQLARNLCTAKGIDADEMFKQVQEQFK